MNEVKKETVGSISSGLILTEEKPDHSATEQMREQLTDFDKNLFEVVDAGKKVYAADFYCVVLTKREQLMSNVIRNYFFHRSTCPTPDYDQATYRYDKKTDSVEFLWVIPNKDACEYMRDNPLEIHPNERLLLQFVLDFYDDTLTKKSKYLNKEELNTPLIIM